MALDRAMAPAFSVVPASGGRHVFKMKTNIMKQLVVILFAVGVLLLPDFSAFAQSNQFHVLVLAERGDQHEAFVVAALEWLKATAEKDHFTYDVFENPDLVTKTFLTKYQVIIQLNYPPYRWSDEAK